MSTCLAVLLLFPGLTLGQEATITGTVQDEDGEPLIGANVIVEGLNIGAAADLDGEYTILIPGERVRGQNVRLVARFVGFTPSTERITLEAGEQTINFVLQEDQFLMEESVVTGVADETPRNRLSFSVARVTEDQLDIAPPSSGAISTLAGRIAGARVVQSSGNPRGDASILLRGATSIARGNSPLIVVDGAILEASTIDINALDIESVEVVKGAAAASVYGSRAQSGVIQIRTKRGGSAPVGETRVTYRGEVGGNFLSRRLPRNSSHWRRVTEDGSQFIDTDGNPTDDFFSAADDVSRGQAISDRPFPGQTFDHVDQILENRPNFRNQISVAHNTETGSYYGSFTHSRNPGVIYNLDGTNRQSARLNIDQDIGEYFDVSASASYSQDLADDPQGQAGGRNPFYDVMFFPANINLFERNESGDPRPVFSQSLLQDNPIYTLENRDQSFRRSRFIGSAQARFRPLDWFSLEADLGYDRLDRQDEIFYPSGYETLEPSSLNDGYLAKRPRFQRGLNTSLTAAFRYNFGEFVGRTRARYQAELSDFNFTFARTQNFVVPGVRRLGIGAEDSDDSTSSTFTRTTQLGYFLISDLSFRDRYLVDFTIRRDGSSLFGPSQRWHTYGRVSGSYRIAEEAWWPFRDISEFRIRASYGTAGNRPNFSDQFEVFSIGASGVSKNQLGNRNLRPEFATEQTYGVNAEFFRRFNLELTYAQTTVEDQILAVPLPGYAGFSSQILNAGTVESNTIEATLGAIVLNTRRQRLLANVVFDRTRQEMTEFNRPTYSTGTQNLFRNGVGENFADLYGRRFATGFSDLPDFLAENQDAFQINDDGYLVPVGDSDWTDGISEGLWGTTVEIGGQEYAWGIPIVAFEDGEQANDVVLGNTAPDFNLGLNLDYSFGGLSVGMLWQAEMGYDVYNFTRQWAYRDNFHGDQDQAGKPDSQKKPLGYYATLYNTNSSSSHFVEDASYLKLRELSVGYSFGQERLVQLLGTDLVKRLSVSLVGRNLLTFTGYSGFDPEVGGTLRRVDSFGYPPFRSVTGRFIIEL